MGKPTKQTVRMIPFALIDDTSIRNPRTDLGNLDELVESFRRNGQLVPLIVRQEHFSGRGAPDAKVEKLREKPAGKIFDIYHLVAGQRRVAVIRRLRDEAREERAKLGKKGPGVLPYDEVMAVIRIGNEVDVRIDQIVENLHRKDMNPVETAEAMKELENLNYPLAEIALRIDRSEAWCRQLLGLRNNGSIELTRAIVRDGLPLSVAFTIAKKPMDEQKSLVEEYKKTAAAPVADGGGKRAAKRRVEVETGKLVRMSMKTVRAYYTRLQPSDGQSNFDDLYLNGMRDAFAAVLGQSDIAIVNLDKRFPLPPAGSK